MRNLSLAGSKATRLGIFALALFVIAGTMGVFFSTPASANNADVFSSVNTSLLGDSWSNPDRAETSNDSYAKTTFGLFVSDQLRGTDFDFAVPTGSTIDGIEVAIERSRTCTAGGPLFCTGSTVRDNTVRLIQGGSVVGDNKASGTAWPATDAVVTYGGPTDLWGLSWTAEQVNALNSGVAFAAERTGIFGGFSANVDQISMTVYYTLPATSLAADSVTATYGDSVNVSATLSPAVAGKSIDFTVNGNSVGSAVTDGSGVATLNTSLIGINVGTYVDGIEASFAGDGEYQASTGAADLTVNVMELTATADAKGKTYGDADPELTYQVTAGTLVSGDSFSGALARDAGEDVGTYAITQGDLSLNSNYNLTYVGDNLTISEFETITITVDEQSKTYGDSDPELTYTFSPALQGGDSFSGSLERVAGEGVGSYAIGQGSLTAGSNYNYSFVGNSLTINQREITVTANATGKTVGDSDPELTYSIPEGSLIGEDSLSGSLTREEGETVGVYAIQVGSLSAGPNYSLAFISADFTISAIPSFTINASAGSNGSIDPSGEVSVPTGGSQTFTMIPDAGFHVANVVVDETPLGAINTYTFTEVSGSHFISVTFAANASGGNGGGGGGGTRPTPPTPPTTPPLQGVLGTQSHGNNTLLRDISNNRIYLVTNGKLYHIKSLAELFAYRGRPVLKVAHEVILGYDIVLHLDGTLLRNIMTKKIYVLVLGKKQPIHTLAELKKHFGKKIYDVTPEILALY